MDPNQFWNYGVVYQNASEFDRAVSMPYEPGSVFKVLTMAAVAMVALVTVNGICAKPASNNVCQASARLIFVIDGNVKEGGLN